MLIQLKISVGFHLPKHSHSWELDQSQSWPLNQPPPL
jgi:hypothetical protein